MFVHVGCFFLYYFLYCVGAILIHTESVISHFNFTEKKNALEFQLSKMLEENIKSTFTSNKYLSEKNWLKLNLKFTCTTVSVMNCIAIVHSHLASLVHVHLLLDVSMFIFLFQTGNGLICMSIPLDLILKCKINNTRPYYISVFCFHQWCVISGRICNSCIYVSIQNKSTHIICISFKFRYAWISN